MARGLDSGARIVTISCDMTPRILIADDQPDLIDALRLLSKARASSSTR
jgi:hypothetical protein